MYFRTAHREITGMVAKRPVFALSLFRLHAFRLHVGVEYPPQMQIHPYLTSYIYIRFGFLIFI